MRVISGWLLRRMTSNMPFISPTASWPSYGALCGGDPPALLVDPDLRTAHLFALDHKTTHNREWGDGVVPAALAAAGAEKVHQEERQMMDELGNLYSPMVGLGFAVYRPPLRVAQGHPLGVRLGPQARGFMSQKLRGPKKISPGARKASPRGVARFFRALLQAGYPASMNTDACLGFSVMDYQAWDIAHGHCEGSLSRGHDAGRGNSTRGGKVEYCPCCVRAAHVAIPKTDPLGIWPMGAATPRGD